MPVSVNRVRRQAAMQADGRLSSRAGGLLKRQRRMQRQVVGEHRAVVVAGHAQTEIAHVGLRLVQCCAQYGEGVRCVGVVTVEKEHIVTLRERERHVARVACAAVGLVQHANAVRMFARERVA